jgi:hypothetical protein
MIKACTQSLMSQAVKQSCFLEHCQPRANASKHLKPNACHAASLVRNSQYIPALPSLRIELNE